MRIKQALPSGVLLLEGRCGKEWKELMRNCAPCHLPIDGSSDLSLANIPANTPCQVCGLSSGAATLLLCDGCQKGWHCHCLEPPLSAVPADAWFCSRCAILR